MAILTQEQQEQITKAEAKSEEKENYITWINICVGLSDNEAKQLRSMDLRGVRIKYKMALKEKTDEMLRKKQGK